MSDEYNVNGGCHWFSRLCGPECGGAEHGNAGAVPPRGGARIAGSQRIVPDTGHGGGSHRPRPAEDHARRPLLTGESLQTGTSILPSHPSFHLIHPSISSHSSHPSHPSFHLIHPSISSILWIPSIPSTTPFCHQIHQIHKESRLVLIIETDLLCFYLGRTGGAVAAEASGNGAGCGPGGSAAEAVAAAARFWTNLRSGLRYPSGEHSYAHIRQVPVPGTPAARS